MPPSIARATRHGHRFARGRPGGRRPAPGRNFNLAVMGESVARRDSHRAPLAHIPDRAPIGMVSSDATGFHRPARLILRTSREDPATAKQIATSSLEYPIATVERQTGGGIAGPDPPWIPPVLLLI